MNELLTTRQLEQLLQVDRITIYRMLDDGRLRGFKVGGQWRFSRAEVEQWLQQQRAMLGVTEVQATSDEARADSQALPLSCIQAIQSVFAEALDIGAITTDLNGIPLTSVSNSQEFCDLILSTEEGRQRCAASWKSLDKGTLGTCHVGLLCGGCRIKVGGRAVAISVGCQFTAQPSEEILDTWQPNLPNLAAELGLSESKLQAAVRSVRALLPEQMARLPKLLRQVAATFAEIGQERLALLDRLRRIAEITTFQS